MFTVVWTVLLIAVCVFVGLVAPSFYKPRQTDTEDLHSSDDLPQVLEEVKEAESEHTQ